MTHTGDYGFLLLGVIVERVTGGSYYDDVEKYSTVGDLVRFADATMTHKLLNAEYTTLLITGKVDTPRPGSKYAYGFQESTVGGVRTVGHGGGAPGQNGDLIIHPDSGYIIAVLSNLDPPAASRLSQYASNRVPAR